MIRESSETQRHEKMLHEMKSTTSIKKTDYCSDEDDSVPGPSTSAPRSHHHIMRTGTDAFIPHDILQRPNHVSLATRMKITPTQQAVFTEALIVEAGGDLSKVSISYATADRSRCQTQSKDLQRQMDIPTPCNIALGLKIGGFFGEQK